MATLEGKEILIFGGSSGIGFGVAAASLQSKASRVIIVSSNPERVANAVNRLTSGNYGEGKVEGHTVNVADTNALKTFVQQIGEVDHIIWTCGDKLPLGFPSIDDEFMKKSFDVRYWGAVTVAQNAKFKPNGSYTLTLGSVVLKPRKTWSIAAGVMGAVESLTRGLAVDLAPIRVNSVCPGFVKTELWDAVASKEQQAQMFATAGEQLLVKHVAEPHELAEAYLFLMKCDFITGQKVAVDGGYLYS